jgi:hypothetical protein
LGSGREILQIAEFVAASAASAFQRVGLSSHPNAALVVRHDESVTDFREQNISTTTPDSGFMSFHA